MTETTTLRALCLCKASQLSFAVPTKSLPLRAYFCHCSICRHTHGTLCSIHARIPPPIVNLSSFKAYETSPNVRRLFCSICGAHMLDNAHNEEGEEWYVAVSMVIAAETTWKINSHFHLESTKDGGLSAWVPVIGGKKLKTWKNERVDQPEYAETGDWEQATPPTKVSSTQKNELKAHCHCGGVEFFISPPRGDHVHNELPENMTPKDKTKWYALNDSCTSCRLASGCAIMSWAIPEISHITLAHGYPYKPIFGTLKVYESSAGVKRTFCGTCGAVATYTCDDRPNYVDVAVGLLEAESGVRAEEYLEWRTHRLAFEEDCLWGGFLQGIKDGLKNYGENVK